MFLPIVVFSVICAISCFFSYNAGKKSGYKLGKHLGLKDGYCQAKMEQYKKEPKQIKIKNKSDAFDWIG
tara:strand:+ start:282 stop:488 length:207 start_codon:yes stop_codon:yes gene_type:complete